MAKRSEVDKFSYLRVEFISDGHNSIYQNGYHVHFMKCTVKEFEALKIKLMLNKITEQDKIAYKSSMENKTRADRLYRDIGYIMQNCKLINIYKFDLSKNILKDNIEKEIDAYLYENKDKCITEYKVYI